MGSEPGSGETASARAARLGPRILVAKALLLALLALGGAWIARMPAVREWLAPAGHLVPMLDRLGWRAAPIFVVSSALLIAVGIPRLLFCPLAGAAFGFWNGMALSTTASMLAYLTVFVVLRGRRGNPGKPMARSETFAFLRHDPGMAGVIVTRLLPVPGMIGTLALSLSPVGTRDYLLGSLIGLVPEAVPLVLLGAGLLEGHPKHMAWLGAAAVILILACYFLTRRLLRRFGQPGNGPGSPGTGR